MSSSERATALAWLLVRVVLAMILIGAAIALLRGTPAGAHGAAKPWIGPDAPSLIPAAVYAIVLVAAGVCIGSGWLTPSAIVAVSATLM
ncbi:MAG TPA: hypothetical protein VG095_02665 [Chthoniobacterales bacterium]|nr:hypothetical protein [Chthoniobacterales bacterium]